MRRPSNKSIAALAPLVQLAYRKLGLAGAIVVVVAALCVFALLGPDDAGRSAGEPPAGSGAPPPAVEGRGANEAVLTDLGRERYRSPAGLVYTRGSQQGHRLKHLMAHATDDPDRDGPHGVFDTSSQDAIVLLVDEAYTQARSGRSTETRREGERTVYEVDLGRRVGYVGGETGARRGHPAANSVRLVVQGDRLITAFPVAP